MLWSKNMQTLGKVSLRFLGSTQTVIFKEYSQMTA